MDKHLYKHLLFSHIHSNIIILLKSEQYPDIAMTLLYSIYLTGVLGSIELDNGQKSSFFFIKGNKKRKKCEENMGVRYIGQMNSGDTHGEPI